MIEVPAAEPTTDQPTEPAGSEDPDSSWAGQFAPHASDPLQIELVLHMPDIAPPLAGWLDKQLTEAARLSNVAQAQINLVVVHDAEMAELHEQYTGVAGTTDVLTFDLRESPAPPSGLKSDGPLEADIILCLDEAERQAVDRGHSVRHELLLYAVHGLMHLLGEDDHDDDAYRRMHAREDALLTQMGFGPLFHPDPET